MEIDWTLAHGYSSESIQRELSNEYQNDRVSMVFKTTLCTCALDESSLSIHGKGVSILREEKTITQPWGIHDGHVRMSVFFAGFCGFLHYF